MLRSGPGAREKQFAKLGNKGEKNPLFATHHASQVLMRVCERRGNAGATGNCVARHVFGERLEGIQMNVPQALRQIGVEHRLPAWTCCRRERHLPRGNRGQPVYDTAATSSLRSLTVKCSLHVSATFAVSVRGVSDGGPVISSAVVNVAAEPGGCGSRVRAPIGLPSR